MDVDKFISDLEADAQKEQRIWSWCSALLYAVVAALLVFAAFLTSARAAPYVLLQGAELGCDQQSNHQQIECGSEEGYEVAIEGGYVVPVASALDVWIGVQAFYNWRNQHGWNEGRGKENFEQATADGETIRLYGLRPALTGVLELWGPLSAYAGLAVGPGAFRTSKGTRLAGFGQARTGLQLEYEGFVLRGGVQAWGTTKVRFGPHSNRLTGWGPMIEIGKKF